MKRFTAFAVLLGLLVAPAAFGQATSTPTMTPTSTPTITPTNTPTRTPTNTPTITPNLSLVTQGTRLTTARLSKLTDFSPAAKDAKLGEIVSLAVRQVRVLGTNAAAIPNLSDVGTVISILAFDKTTGAPATKTLLLPGTDYTVSSGVVTTTGDQSGNLLVVTYRP